MKPYMCLLSVPLALALAAPTPAEAQGQGRAGNRFAAMDTNRNGVITRAEWRGNDQSFRIHDWNNDGVLSGDELRPGAQRPARDADTRFDVADREYVLRDWTAERFANQDRNGDGRLTRDEWQFDGESFARADRNKDGVLTRTEVIGTSEPPPESFTSVDVNRDRAITRDEWHWSRASFDRLDANGDGRLSREEYTGTAVQAQQSAARNAGRDRGAIEGRAAGREDRERNQGWDLEGQRELETADSGYELRMGSKAEYQAGYREAFRRAYREGWNLK